MTEAEGQTPAEARVRDLVQQLRGAPPSPPSTALVRRVVRTARWQRVARGALVAAGQVLGALAQGVSLLVGRRP
jgi:hypothetical protein